MSREKVLIVYHSQFGATEMIARRISQWLEESGYSTILSHFKELDDSVTYDVVIAGCPVYAGKLDEDFISFIQSRKEAWNRIPSFFFLVSLSKAGNDQKALDELKAIRESITEKTGWSPTRSIDVAGTCWYRKYNFFVRWVLKRISKKSGGHTDTSRNHEYTNWEELKHELDDFTGHLPSSSDRDGS